MEQGQVIGRLFVPADQETTKAIHPRMCPFDHPSACFEPCLLSDGFGFFSTPTDMGRKAECLKEITHFIIVVSLIQTHPLWLLLRRLWTVDNDAFERRAHQFHIMAVCTLNGQTNGNSMPLSEQTAFHSALAAISGIRAGFFP